jgi:rod shape-determining protein MreC
MSRIRSEPLVFVLVLVGALLMFLHQARFLQPFEDTAVVIFLPVQEVVSSTFGGVDHFFGGFQDAAAWRQKYDERQALVDQLLVENTQLREKEKENETLRAMLSFKQANQNLQLIASEVIGRDSNPLLHFIIIDRGTSDGITRNMPVITARGLVGQISDVYPHSAKVILITDLASSVNVVSQENRTNGVVQGEVDGGITMRFIPQGEKIEVGNIILTSGLGGRFPKRLVVGQVQTVTKKDVELFQSAVIRPSVDFQTLEAVLVITNFALEQ